MRYVYSVIRFVPDPARGEFVNIGAIVGSDEGSDWKLRMIDNFKRARALDDKGVLAGAQHFADQLGSQIDQYEAYIAMRIGERPIVSEQWLQQIYQSSENIVQLSEPTPMVAEDADEAMELIFQEMLIDPESRRFPFQKKTVAMAAVRRAYTALGLRKGQNFTEDAEIQAEHHKRRFDFAVLNGRVVQLTQAWSFQIPRQDELAEDIKAWAWTVRDLRKHGARLINGHDPELHVRADVDIEAVYIPPVDREPHSVLGEALSAFGEVGVVPRQITEAEEVARRARRQVPA